MADDELTRGILFDVQGFSVHDGPGCRTLLFFKGCTLHCAWCSNPEGISPCPEPLWNGTQCTFDSRCVNTCPEGAITISGDQLRINRTRCRNCSVHRCAETCYSGALRIAGKEVTAAALFALIQRDRRFWGDRGGVTLTGGEPFHQPGFAEAILKRCHEAYIHTAAETCGNVPWEHIAPSLPYLEWIFFDLKQMDETAHTRFTGASNRLILENARRIAREFPGRMIFRLPLIPGVNNTPGHIARVAEFVRSTGRNEVNILPVHHLGREKYRLLQQEYYTDCFTQTPEEELQEICAHFSACGITPYAGSHTPF